MAESDAAIKKAIQFFRDELATWKAASLDNDYPEEFTVFAEKIIELLEEGVVEATRWPY